MFKNEFQGGPYFEIFSAQGKDPVSQWKLSGSSGIRKLYDKDVKSFVFNVEGGGATTKMQLPKDAKNALSLIQRYLIMQIYVPKGADFSVDLGVTDIGNNKRRLFLSTAHKETHPTPLHGKFPLGVIRRATWLNLCFDLVSLVGETWKGQTFKSVESICISASCKLRRIFTMKSQPPDTTDDDDILEISMPTNAGEVESIPKQCQLAQDVPQETQVVTVAKIRHFEWKILRGGDPSAKPSSLYDLDLNSSGGKKSQDGYHIAFGTKVPMPAPGSAHRRSISKEGNLTSRRSATRSRMEGVDPLPSSRTSLGGKGDRLDVDISRRERKNSDPGTNLEDPEVKVDKESLRTSHTWTDGADGSKDDIPFVRPHPPREPSGDARTRRKPRIKSAGKERTSNSASHERSSHSQDRGELSGSGGVGNIRQGSSDRDRGGSGGKERSSGSAGKDRTATRSYSGSRDSASRHRHHSTGHSRSNSKDITKCPPRVLADDREVDDILLMMQQSARRDQNRPQTQSESSEEESDEDEEEDSLNDVIETLKDNVHLDEGEAREYEDSDDREEEVESCEDQEDKLYMFSSPPKSAPRHKLQQGSYRLDQSQTKKNHKNRIKTRRKNSEKSGSDRGAKPESDFVYNGSSEEEVSIRSRVLRQKKNLNSKTSMQAKLQNGQPSKQNAKLDVGGEITLQIPQPQVAATSLNSQSRMSIRKKSLREIPKNDVRLSQQKQKNYDFTKYQMEDLSESFEANMLQHLKRQALDGTDDEDEKADKKQQSRGKNSIQRHMYGNDSLTDSSDDTSFGTMKAPPGTLVAPNYQDEMKLAPSKLTQDFLSQSNPRDWGNVFSPPIVVPSQMKGAVNPQELSPNTVEDSRYKPRHVNMNEGGQETDEEEELDLLYDPCLNCYFDPKTCKYYELV